MKNNFYLQHPLMAMQDPRMQNLAEKEGLRGTGAYWFIIEKLAIVPESRAQPDYLKPFCNGRKISFAYLIKIIREYELFIQDKEGYIMPAQLNPTRKKKKEKAANSVEETADSNAKNGDKSQKTSRKNAPKEASKTHKQLEIRSLSNSNGNNKEGNIKDNVTTTSTEEKEETADADKLQLSDTGGQPSAIRPWRELVADLVQESSWLDIACMQSGYSLLLKRHIREAVKLFEQHIEAYDKGDNLLYMSDVHRYFINYVSPGSRTSQALHSALLALDAKRQTAAPPDLYHHEQLVNGKRTYLGCPIPDDAPPRPDATAFWNEEIHSWVSQQQPAAAPKAKHKHN